MSTTSWKSLIGFCAGALSGGAVYLGGVTDPLLQAAAGAVGSLVVNALIFPENE